MKSRARHWPLVLAALFAIGVTIAEAGPGAVTQAIRQLFRAPVSVQTPPANGSILGVVAGEWTAITSATAIQGGLDTLSATHGAIIYRDSAAWAGLAPSTADFVLTTQGSGQDPVWKSLSILVPNLSGWTDLGTTVAQTTITDQVVVGSLTATAGAQLTIVGATAMSEGGDPAAVADRGFIYTKDVATITELFYRASNGTITQLSSPTPSGWTRSAPNVALTTVTDEVSIGLASGTAKLNVQAEAATGAMQVRDSAGTLLLEVGRLGNTRTEAIGFFDSVGSDKFQLTIATFGLANDFAISWRSLGQWFSGVADTGLARDSAGVIRVTDGSTGVGAVKLDYAILPERADPTAVANTGLVYTKDVSTVTELFYRASDGTVTQLTPAAAGGSGFTDNGATVELTTSTDGVGIGSTPGANDKFVITGDTTRRAISLTAGAGSGGSGGNVTLLAGTGAAENGGGNVNITGGTAGSTEAGGSVTISGGTSDAGSTGGSVTIQGGATSGNAAGGTALVNGRIGSGTGAGGSASLIGGQGGATGNGGGASVDGGAGGATSGNGGTASLVGGLPTSGNGGSVVITGRPGVGGANVGGPVTITAGNSVGASTGASITTTAGMGGATGAGGALTFTSGAGGGTSGASGAVSLSSGATTDGNTGAVTIASSNATGTNRSTGNVILTCGTPTGSGTRGVIATTGNLTTAAAGTYDLGSASTGWKRLYLDTAIDTTAGDSATINKAAGRFRKDATGTTFTLTNSYITANSIVHLTFVTSDVTAFSVAVAAGAGTATITFNAVPTGNVDMNFLVINAD